MKLLANQEAVCETVLSMPERQIWKDSEEELKRLTKEVFFLDLISRHHVTSTLENIHLKLEETLRTYIYRYSKMHHTATGTDASDNTDKISQMNYFLTSLQDCFELALQFEEGYQLCEGVNIAGAANIMTLKQKIFIIW